MFGMTNTGWRVRAGIGTAAVARLSVAAVAIALRLTLCIGRAALLATLVLLEPLVRLVLVPSSVLGMLVTLLFGFVAGDPHFPRWGMLALSVSALLLYSAYLGVIVLVEGGGRGRN